MSSILKNFELDLDILSGQLVYVPSPNFGYKTIPEGCCMIIPEYQEMILYKELLVDGNLIIEGDVGFVE